MRLLNVHGEFERDDPPKLMKLRSGEPKQQQPMRRRATCAVCQRNFWAENSTERFCSAKCRRAYADMQESRADGRLCPVCGRPVIGRTNRVYCSYECKKRAENSKKR